MRSPAASRVERILGAGVVIAVVVRIGGAADAVARPDVEPDAVALREHHRRGPYFDVEPHDLAAGEPCAPRMRVIRAPWQRSLQIELAVRGAQPAFRDGYHLPLLAQLEDVA